MTDGAKEAARGPGSDGAATGHAARWGRDARHGRERARARRTSRAAEQVPKLLADLPDDGRVDDGRHLFNVVEQRLVKESLVAILQPLEEEVLLHVSLASAEPLDDLLGLHVHAQLARGYHAADVQPVALRQAERRALVHNGVVDDAHSATARELGLLELVVFRVHHEAAVGAGCDERTRGHRLRSPRAHRRRPAGDAGEGPREHPGVGHRVRSGATRARCARQHDAKDKAAACEKQLRSSAGRLRASSPHRTRRWSCPATARSGELAGADGGGWCPCDGRGRDVAGA